YNLNRRAIWSTACCIANALQRVRFRQHIHPPDSSNLKFPCCRIPCHLQDPYSEGSTSCCRHNPALYSLLLFRLYNFSSLQGWLKGLLLPDRASTHPYGAIPQEVQLHQEVWPCHLSRQSEKVRPSNADG